MASQRSLAGETAISQLCTRTESIPLLRLRRQLERPKLIFHHLHSCNNGKLAPPVPSEDGTFLVMSLQSPHLDSEFIQASGLAFRIGGGPPATYCPARVGSACPAGEETVWTCSSGYCGLVCYYKSGYLALSLISVDCRGAWEPADLRRPQRRCRLYHGTLCLRSARITVFRILTIPWK